MEGKCIFTWLSRQCSEVETKEEYDQSYNDLKIFLTNRRTCRDLSQSCRQAVLELQENLRSKEAKLGNHFRLFLRNCMDAMTTSPVESCNHSVKHGSFSVHSNMNLDMTCAKILDGANTRIQRRRNAAEREMAKFNHASRGITKDVLITKGQRLVDREHDDRLKYCCVQIDADNFIVWNFENEDLGEMNKEWPWTELPRFHRVRTLALRSHCGKHFITCSCGFRERVGIPCRHMLCVLGGEVEISMMDVRWWKAFHKHYGEESKIGETFQISFYQHYMKFTDMFR